VVDAPEVNVAIFAFLLNYPWEFLQVPFFEGMRAARHWDAVLFCSRATLGDASIAIVAFWTVAAFTGTRQWIRKPAAPHVVGFAGAGVTMTIALEWLATEVLARWTYADAMPTLPFLGTGLLPILQWILLPPLIVGFVHRQLR
jgi:hypothetical protein